MKKLVAVIFLVMSACLLFTGSAMAQDLLVGTWTGKLDGVTYRGGYSEDNPIQLVVQNELPIKNATFFRGTMSFSSPFGAGNDLPVTGFVLGEDLHLTGDFFHGGGRFEVGTSLSGFLHFQKASAGSSTATARFTLTKAP